MKIALQRLKRRAICQTLLIGSITITLCQLLYVYLVWIEQPPNCPSMMSHGDHRGYVLSLSYYDQITSAAMRVASLQCWAAQHGKTVVEPFVNASYLGMPPVHHTLKYSSQLRFEDLFDSNKWNLEGRRIFGCFSPLAKWEDFVHNAPRDVVAVQILYTGNENNQEICTFPHIMKYWAAHFKPHGFRIIKRICLDIKNFWWLTDEDFSSQILEEGTTLIFEQWRGVGKYITLKDSGCTNKKGRTVIWNGLDPSLSVQLHAQEYLKHYLRGGDSFLAVMLRVEFTLQHKDYSSVAKCRDRVERLVSEMKEKHNLNAVFLTTDIGNYGSQEMPEFIGSQKVSDYLESILAAVYGKPTTVEEYEQTFKRVISQHIVRPEHKYKHYDTSVAYISTLQKAIASRATCMLLIGGGYYQLHAEEWYHTLHRFVPQGLCIQRHTRC